jgi:hypothetical protein
MKLKIFSLPSNFWVLVCWEWVVMLENVKKCQNQCTLLYMASAGGSRRPGVASVLSRLVLQALVLSRVALKALVISRLVLGVLVLSRLVLKTLVLSRLVLEALVRSWPVLHWLVLARLVQGRQESSGVGRKIKFFGTD